MSKFDVYESSDAYDLQKILNALPEGSQVFSIYSRGQSHWAWVQVPEMKPEPSIDSEKKTDNKKFEHQKRRGK